MILKNKISYIFGPTGSSSGMIFFGIGLITMLFTWRAAFIMMFGALFAFSRAIVIIDTDKKRVKWCEYYFGIIPVGKWISVDPSMSLGYKITNDGWSARSLSNRRIDVPNENYTIILYDKHDLPIFPLMKVKTEIEMTEKMELLSTLLQIPI
ncbi:MAG: hypothetical protein RBS29_05495 [Bacteroidales bacterium]|jgi:hypothetical protein|nr:hypothetical protein [Bacteroidales bacterium]